MCKWENIALPDWTEEDLIVALEGPEFPRIRWGSSAKKPKKKEKSDDDVDEKYMLQNTESKKGDFGGFDDDEVTVRRVVKLLGLEPVQGS